MFPPSFEYELYVKDKPFLSSASEAKAHFENEGLVKGLQGSSGCDQGYFIRLIQHLRPTSILEIGPGSNPKLRGDNVYYFDVKSEEQLRSRYAGEPGKDTIPEKIHYVDGSGNLRNIGRTFDIVFSCHMIEHSFDLIEHLNSVDALLNPGGYYFVIAPNKNYTFDYFKPLSTPEEIIGKHVDSHGVPTLDPKTILLEKCRRTHNDFARHWAGDHGEPNFDKVAIQQAIKQFDVIRDNPVARSGFHTWIFTDKSFIEIIDRLQLLEMTGMKLEACYNTVFGSCSFNAILGKD